MVPTPFRGGPKTKLKMEKYGGLGQNSMEIFSRVLDKKSLEKKWHTFKSENDEHYFG